MHALAYSVVDAFTSTTLKGNSAAVIVLDSNTFLPDNTSRRIRDAHKCSNEAVRPPMVYTDGRVPLWGHATLAAASVLFAAPAMIPQSLMSIQFETLSGVVAARTLLDGRIELEFSANGPGNVTDDALRKNVEGVIRRASSVSPQYEVRFVGVGHGPSFERYLLTEVDGVDLASASFK